jgi:hypothetical protein
MAIALIALAITITGTPLASASVATIAKVLGLNHKQTRQVKSIVHQQLSAKAPSLSVQNAAAVTTAAMATSATTATNATSATNTTELGGQAPGAFESSSEFERTGTVTTTAGNTVPFATFGPFTLTLQCSTPSSGQTKVEIDAVSTVNNSEGLGALMANAGTTYGTIITRTSTTVFAEGDDSGADFFAPGSGDYVVDATVGVNWTATGTCFGNALISASS